MSNSIPENIQSLRYEHKAEIGPLMRCKQTTRAYIQLLCDKADKERQNISATFSHAHTKINITAHDV